ncbi:MAG: hypothetical protein ACRDWT_18505 [Jatrophihabitantaceae bacterium]
MRIVNGFELPRILVPLVARRLGLTRAQVRTEIARENWQRMARGVVLTRPDPPTRLDWAETGLALGGPRSALSGWDALRLVGIGDARPPDPQVLVLTESGRSRSMGGVRIRRTDRPFAAHTTSVNHPLLPYSRVVPMARAVVDTAALYEDLRSVRAVVTSSVQKGRCSLHQLVAELGPGRTPGSRLLRQVLGEIADGARSVAEAEAAACLQRADVPAFELNVPIVDRSGTVIFVVDVLWRELRATLEVDSRECHRSDAQWQATLDRHNQLTTFGLSVTHYPPTTIRRRGRPWVGQVEHWLRTRAAEIGVPWLRGTGVVRPPPGSDPPPFVV